MLITMLVSQSTWNKKLEKIINWKCQKAKSAFFVNNNVDYIATE